MVDSSVIKLNQASTGSADLDSILVTRTAEEMKSRNRIQRSYMSKHGSVPQTESESKEFCMDMEHILVSRGTGQSSSTDSIACKFKDSLTLDYRDTREVEG